MSYNPPIRDLQFSLRTAAEFERLEAAFPAADADTVTAILDAAGAFAADVLAPLNRPVSPTRTRPSPRAGGTA